MPNDSEQSKQQKKENGDAYVRAAQQFDSYTLSVMLCCPDRWRDYLIDPIVHDTRRIADDAMMANACYVRMDKQSTLDDVIVASTSASRYWRMPCARSGSSNAILIG